MGNGSLHLTRKNQAMHVRQPQNLAKYISIRKSNHYPTEEEFGFTRSGHKGIIYSYPDNEYCTVSKNDIERHWDEITRYCQLDNKLRHDGTGGRNVSVSTVLMWLLGDGSNDGLVFWNEDDEEYHLRYIPVDFNLFDSIMAELNLRRQSNNNPDIAVYKQSEWGSKKDTSSWWIEVSKSISQGGFDVIIKEKIDSLDPKMVTGSSTPDTVIDFASNETVKQFAEYDWSTANANTIEDNKPIFYVSWSEKMLLQEFFEGTVGEY